MGNGFHFAAVFFSAIGERTRFVRAALKHLKPFTVPCQIFGISRRTGYKWLQRFQQEGRAGLARPLASPAPFAATHVAVLASARAPAPPPLPALGRKKDSRPLAPQVPARPSARRADDHQVAAPALCPMPRRPRPFGSTGAWGLSALSVWWQTLGIAVEFIRPGHPADNGAHEQMLGNSNVTPPGHRRPTPSASNGAVIAGDGIVGPPAALRRQAQGIGEVYLQRLLLGTLHDRHAGSLRPTKPPRPKT